MSAQDEPDKLNRADKSPDRSMQGFEAELAGLSPRTVHLDRDRLMFLAGQASASSGMAASAYRGWAWPAAFSAMSALAATFLLTLVLRSPREVVKIVQVPAENVQTGDDTRADRQNDRLSRPAERVAAESEPSQPEAIAEMAAGRTAQGRPYVELRDRVLAMGFDGWPSDTGQRGEMGDNEGRRPQSPAAYHDLLDSLLHDG
jgi:hypothetical protein